MPGGILLQLHVQPGASRTELAGRHGDALKIRVAGVPVGGRANRELARFLAEILGVPGTNIALVRGGSGRRKTVTVQGVTVEGAERLLGLEDPD